MKELDPVIRIVDDDQTVRNALTVFLQMADLHVRCYESAGRFLNEDDFTRPGVVILDVRMPDMNGIECQTEMKRRRVELPIIFLSAHGDIEMAAEAVRAGAKNFLVKPPKSEKLLALVEEAMAESVERMKERAYGRSLEQQWMSLTPAEQRVASMVAKGLSNSVVADALEISERTIRAHKEAIYRKLDIENAVELAEFLRERADFFGGGDAAA
jgi:FixJ family two-component response regulator